LSLQHLTTLVGLATRTCMRAIDLVCRLVCRLLHNPGISTSVCRLAPVRTVYLLAKCLLLAGLLTENRKPTCRIALGRTVDLFDVRKVDAGLGATLEKLAAAAGASGTGGRGHAGPLTVDGVPIEDLCLAFVLPGCVGLSVSNCLQSNT